jgi:hypothetical protein
MKIFLISQLFLDFSFTASFRRVDINKRATHCILILSSRFVSDAINFVNMPRRKCSYRITNACTATTSRKRSYESTNATTCLHETVSPVNVGEVSKPSSRVSADTRSSFAKKLKRARAVIEEPITDSSERTIIDLPLLLKFVASFNCPSCNGKIETQIVEGKSKGFAKYVEAVCLECEFRNSFCTSYPLDKTCRSSYKINKDVVAASLFLDMGACKLNKFCEALNLPSLHHKTFQKFAKKIVTETSTKQSDVFQTAASIVRQAHNKDPDDKEPLDIAVSFDGSWLTRGHKSLIGVGSVIEVQTGLVLDVHVTSLHCQTCATTGERMKGNKAEYEVWLAHHKENGCTVNYSGKLYLYLLFYILVGLNYTTYLLNLIIKSGILPVHWRYI